MRNVCTLTVEVEGRSDRTPTSFIGRRKGVLAGETDNEVEGALLEVAPWLGDATVALPFLPLPFFPGCSTESPPFPVAVPNASLDIDGTSEVVDEEGCCSLEGDVTAIVRLVDGVGASVLVDEVEAMAPTAAFESEAIPCTMEDEVDATRVDAAAVAVLGLRPRPEVVAAPELEVDALRTRCSSGFPVRSLRRAAAAASSWANEIFRRILS